MNEKRVRWPQFELRNVFISFSLVCAMLALAVSLRAIDARPTQRAGSLAPLEILWLLSVGVGMPVLFGAAIGALVGKPLRGAFVTLVCIAPCCCFGVFFALTLLTISD